MDCQAGLLYRVRQPGMRCYAGELSPDERKGCHYIVPGYVMAAPAQLCQGQATPLAVAFCEGGSVNQNVTLDAFLSRMYSDRWIITLSGHHSARMRLLFALSCEPAACSYRSSTSSGRSHTLVVSE